MITMLVVAMLLIFGSLAMALVAAVPLWRTLGTAIDCWADSVHGEDPGRIV